MQIRDRASWLTLALGFVLVIGDTADLNVGGVAVLGFVCLAVGLWGIGAFTREFWIAEGPADDVSRLDLLDGVGVKPPVDLTKLTDAQLEALRREQMRAAWEAVETNRSTDLDVILASLDESRAELDRRLNILRAQAGWVWPKEGNR